MPGLRDVSRKGALPALAALYRQHPKAMGAMDFVRASGVDAGTAARARDELAAAGVVDVRLVREVGAVKEFEIRLTPLGLALGPHVLAMDDVFTAHSRPPGLGKARRLDRK